MRAIQVCGTGSDVGKSIIVTALCRIFLQDGFMVCPFKAQNMSLNSFVTKDGGEMGRAQVVQAQASRIEPSVDMNPVLIKPTGDRNAQIIVCGKPIGNMNVMQYTKYKRRLLGRVRKSFQRLADEYEIVVIEGAGSPAEINLKRHDIVNMEMARYAHAPVILVGDIDKGGVFAWLVGTLELLTKEERKRIKGIIINKFRGDKRLLKRAIDFLEKKTKIKVLGVVPYFKDIKIPEEDSVSLETSARPATDDGIRNTHDWRQKIGVAVIKLPHISNFTDFNALESESDVNLYYVRDKDGLKNPDVIILPGTKNTISDLQWLKQSGLANHILSTIDYQLSTIVIGICGGYQMLGNIIYDRYHLESNHTKIEGLKVLPIETHLKKEKTLSRVKAKDLLSGKVISGYEIHHGYSKVTGNCNPVFEIFERNARKTKYADGLRTSDNRILGTYMHGIFDTDSFRRDFLNRIRRKKGWPAITRTTNFNLEREFDKLADLVRNNIDMKSVHMILNHAL